MENLNVSNCNERLFAPLNDVLLNMEEIEDKTYNLTREEFFTNKDNAAAFLQKRIINLGRNIGALNDTYPELLNKFGTVCWNKLVKLTKALEKGYWSFVYQLAWRFVSSDVKELKKTVLELLELNSNPEQLKT